jgi:hypothetical protein
VLVSGLDQRLLRPEVVQHARLRDAGALRDPPERRRGVPALRDQLDRDVDQLRPPGFLGEREIPAAR